jgi:hypothetical protein
VLVFDLADVAKALAQFEHSSEALVFALDASLEATEQFEEATEVDEAFLGHCLRLHPDCFVVAFGHAGAAALRSNMVDVVLQWSVSSVAEGCYESFVRYPSATSDTDCLLPDCGHTTPRGGCTTPFVDVYNLSMAFAGLCELL